MKRVKLGDIFEIETKDGLCYVHYFDDTDLGLELVRVLSDCYQERPNDIEQLALSIERYIVSFPVKAANRKKIVMKVGFLDKAEFTAPKFMRTPLNIGGEFKGWHIVNTRTLSRELVEELSNDQKKLSPWGVWNDTLLKERLESDWKLENWNPWD